MRRSVFRAFLPDFSVEDIIFERIEQSHIPYGGEE
jgi:hypothetical protein